ncbi:MAG: DUF4249 domain-containing protein [Bacteroidales bacterium]|nr:DUF4249 domain-containing protein [Bacteroidales bacterium]
MKKIIYMMMAAALLAACDNPLEYKPADKEDTLVLNAFLDAGELQHEVSLSVSGTEFVRKVKEAELRCFVNGTKVATVTKFEESEEYGNLFRSKMHFDAALKTGDVVRIEVDAEGRFSAWNEQTVPEQPDLVSVDTATVVRHNDYYDDYYYRFESKLNDGGSEEEFYRITISAITKNYFYDQDHNYISSSSGEHECWLEIDNDPILNEGYIAGGDNTLDLGLGTQNNYTAFSDSQFNGKTANLRPMVGTYYIFSINEYPDNTKYITTEAQAKVRIQKFSKPYYLYLKALNTLQDGELDLALEGVQIPDNVEGGIGFVALSNSKDITMDLGQKEYELVYY